MPATSITAAKGDAERRLRKDRLQRNTEIYDEKWIVRRGRDGHPDNKIISIKVSGDILAHKTIK